MREGGQLTPTTVVYMTGACYLICIMIN